MGRNTENLQGMQFVHNVRKPLFNTTDLNKIFVQESVVEHFIVINIGGDPEQHDGLCKSLLRMRL